MAFSINTNIASLQSQYYLNKTQQFQAKTINEVTSGLRIVNAGDDAAGLAVANAYRSDEAVLTQGISNLNSATATLQTIDAGMSNIGNLLDRARTLATQSASQTFTGDRSALNNEFQSVLTEINRQSQSIGMNGGGTFNSSMQVFVGGGRTSGAISAATNGSVSIDLTGSAVDTTSLGLAATGAEGTADLRASATILSSAKTAGAGGTAASFTFYGSGFTGGVTVTVAGSEMAKVTTTDDLSAKINSAIASAALSNSFFSDSSVKASVNSAGHLAFTGSNSFSVLGTDTDSGNELFGNAAGITVNSGGASAVASMAFVNLAATSQQSVTISYRDSSGANQSTSLAITNANSTNYTTMAGAINTALGSTGGIYAVATDATHISFMSKTNQDFSVSTTNATVSSSGATIAQGLNTGAVGATGSTKLASTVSSDISTQGGAVSAVTALATAVAHLGLAQGTVGKHENQLNYALSLASTQVTNLASSESQIRDADLAAQAANLSKAQVLTQAGVAALAQANSAPQAVLSLLKG